MIKKLLNLFLKARRVPQDVAPDGYALIKLSRFDDLEVLIMEDKANGGLSVSYNSNGLGADEQQDINDEIQQIINNQINNILEEE